jgi:RNA polymerase sigma factor (sigma-70 family)
VLGAVLEDAIDRRRNGETPQAADYIARHPDLADAIAGHFELIALLEGWEAPGADLQEASSAVSPESPSDERADALDAAMAELPALARRVIVLRLGEELSWEAAAQRLGVPVEKARRSCAEALARLVSVL